MAHDNSIASKVEAWMVTTIGTADTGSILKAVGHFEGTVSQIAQGQAEELLRDRDPLAKVVCIGAPADNLSAGDQQLASEYLVFVGVRNDRGEGTPRIGDANNKGVHAARSLIQKALHGQHPGVSDSNYAAEVCMGNGWETIWQTATEWIIAMKFIVAEVPKPA